MTHIEAIKQMLEALEMPCNFWNKTQFIKVQEAIEVGRKAIATEESSATQEPVAHIVDRFQGQNSGSTTPEPMVIWFGPMRIGDSLYTHPQPKAQQEPKREPLTDQQIEQIENGIWRPEFFDDVERQANREFARAIEAAHGIKGEA